MANPGRKRNPRSSDADDITAMHRGFPWAFDGVVQPRRIARDIWGLLESELRSRLTAGIDLDKALAFTEQAFEFFTAASTHRQLSRPLLYYYAFLNLGKAALTLDGITFPDKLQHGIVPEYGTASTLSQHRVKWFADTKHDQAFAKFAKLFSFNRSTDLAAGAANVEDILAEVPCVHRAFCQVNAQAEEFIQADVALLKHKSQAWWGISIDTERLDAPRKQYLRSLPSTADCEAVAAIRESRIISTYWDYESSTCTRTGRGRSTEIAARELARRFRRDLRGHVILQGDGYRLYVGARRTVLSQWCSSLALLFYLGSLTRYRPHLYHLATEKFTWPIGELLDALPEQMLYILSSWMCGTEVVRPFAVGVEGRR